MQRRRGKAGVGGAAVVCVRSLGLSSLMNLSVSCPRQTIIIIKSTKWWLLYHHQRNTLLFSYFQICLKIFLWVALPRGALHLAPGLHTPMYVFCIVLFIYMGITSLEQSWAEQTHYHKKKRKIILIYLCSLNLNCAPCQLSLEMLRVVIVVVAIIVMLFVAVVVSDLMQASTFKRILTSRATLKQTIERNFHFSFSFLFFWRWHFKHN